MQLYRCSGKRRLSAFLFCVTKAAEYLAPINALHAKATSTVALLKERRSALISAAVIGQLKITTPLDALCE